MKKYQGYADSTNTVYATVISNVDLNSFGFKTNSDYRLVSRI